MQLDDARRVLGVGADAGDDELRRAFRTQLRSTHPDLSSSADATERTIALNEAYRLLVAALREPSADPTAPKGQRGASAGADAGSADAQRGAGSASTRADRPPEPELTIELVDDSTIALGAPGDETLFLICEAAHQLGEITYLDPAAGLVEVVVEFVEAPTSSVVFTLQGRATGVTDVFCTVEPLSGGLAPPADAVTRLVLDTVAQVAVEHRRRPVVLPGRA